MQPVHVSSSEGIAAKLSEHTILSVSMVGENGHYALMVADGRWVRLRTALGSLAFVVSRM